MKTKIDRRSFLAAGAAALSGCALTRGNRRTPIALRKLGTFDRGIVEANPIVFRGKPWLMEYIRSSNRPEHCYRTNKTGKSYFRFLDLTDFTTLTPPFAHGLHMGNAFVDGDRVIVTAIENWGKSRIYQTESTDLIHWTPPRVILSDPKWAGYNTTMCRAEDRLILSFELGKPRDLVGQPFTMFFAESRDGIDWKLIDGARMGEKIYTGAPMLRYFDGTFYYFHLEGSYEEGFVTRVARSKDLKTWEFSPHVVLGFDEWDRAIHPKGQFSAAELDLIQKAVNINASDLDMCEYNGKLLAFYSWGNQRGTEFSALAEAPCTERAFCESYFD